MDFRAYPQLYRAINPTKTPHILIFQIAAIRPTVYLYRQTVLPLIYISGNIKLRRSHGILAISYFFPINPYIHSRLNSFEVQIQLLIFHILRNIKSCHISPHRIAILITKKMLGRFSCHFWLVFLKRICPIGINRFSITL